MTTQIVQQKLIPQGVILTLAMYNSLQSRRCTFDEANFLQSCPSSIPHYPSSYQLTGHTKRRRDAGTDDGTAGEVIKTTCSCPVLIVKDDGTDDGLTFRHCCASHSGGDGTVRLTGLSDKLSRHLTVYPGLSHLMTDIAVTRCYDNKRSNDFPSILCYFLLGFEQL